MKYDFFPFKLLCRVLGTAGVKALSFTSRKQSGEGLYCALLLFKTLAGVHVGVLFSEEKDRFYRMTEF